MNAFAFFGVLSLATMLGCERTAREPDRSDQRSAPTAGVASAAAPVVARPAEAPSLAAKAPSAPAWSFPVDKSTRVVAVGDLHGDFAATRRVLKLARLIGDRDEWIAGKDVFVQTGDQLDRAAEERQIIELLERLSEEAEASGGRVVVLNGNHETMNVLGDFRYVVPSAVDSFAGMEPSSRYAASVSGPFQSRARAFLPGGAMALLLAKRPIVAEVGETVFVHGGLGPEHARLGFEVINRDVSAFLRGESTRPPEVMMDSDGPLWTRLFGEAIVSESACRVLDEMLRIAGKKRLVVGHTVQKEGISSACGGKVWRIDVGMSSAYGSGNPEALEIRGDAVKVLSAGD